MPEGSTKEGAAPAGPDQEQQALPLHARYGFASEDAMAAAFDELKADLKKHKQAARSASEMERKLAEYEAAEQKRREAEMTEAQKLAQRIAAMEKQLEERDAALAATRREALLERSIAQRLAGRAPAESAILRRLLVAAAAGQEYADERELVEIFGPVEAEFDALRASLASVSEPAPSKAGGSPGLASAPPPAARTHTAAAVFADYMRLPIAGQVAAARRAAKKG